MTQTCWVERRSWGISLCAFPSTRERRLVFFRGGSAIVKSIGDHWVPLLGGVEAVGVVTMTPVPVPFVVPGELTSLEGVKLTINAMAVLQVKELEEAIRLMALGPDQQQQIAISQISRVFQRIALRHPWRKLRADRAALSSEVFEEIRSSDISHCAVNLVDLSVEQIVLQDTNLERHASELAVTESAKQLVEVKAEFERKKIQEEASAAELRLDADIKQHEKHSELSRKRLGDELHTNQLRADQDIRLNAQRKESELKSAEALAAIFEKPGGLWAVNPEAASKIELEKLRVERENNERLTKLLLEMGKQAHVIGTMLGQQQVLSALAEKQSGMTIKTPDLSWFSPPGELTASSIGQEEGAKLKSGALDDPKPPAAEDEKK